MNDITRKPKFKLPPGIIYLDGNSLGPLPVGVSERVQNVLTNEWGANLIQSWNIDNWMEQPVSVANRIGRLIGAPTGTVVLGDTLSLKVYQALAAALAKNPQRRVILSDTGNFPTDLYMAEGLIKQLDRNHELRLVEPDRVMSAINDDIAAVLLTQVDYRTGRLHDMSEITQSAHAVGATIVWDLAHSAGAIPVDVESANVDFAVGCTYKYLNGGPGAPAFIYVRPDLTDNLSPALCGWLGHAKPFDFELNYEPGKGIERLRVGTPPVIQIATLDTALDVWENVDMQALRTLSIELSELFITQVEKRCGELTLASPRNPHSRGSQVSFACENGYAVMQALIAHGLIGDFRAPNLIRFGITPLYIDKDDILAAVDILENVLTNQLWNTPEYHERSRVT